MRRIEWQVPLPSLQEVHNHETEKAQRNHGAGVLYPRLFFALADSAKAIDQPFQGVEDGMKQSLLPLKNTIHVRAQRLRERQQNQEEEHDLCNADPSHFSTSKLFRPKQRIHQVDKKSGRHNSRNGIFHGTLLKALGGFRETPEQNKKCNRDSDIEHIQQHSPLATIVGSKTGRPKTGRALESTKTTR